MPPLSSHHHIDPRLPTSLYGALQASPWRQKRPKGPWRSPRVDNRTHPLWTSSESCGFCFPLAALGYKSSLCRAESEQVRKSRKVSQEKFFQHVKMSGYLVRAQRDLKASVTKWMLTPRERDEKARSIHVRQQGIMGALEMSEGWGAP